MQWTFWCVDRVVDLIIRIYYFCLNLLENAKKLTTKSQGCVAYKALLNTKACSDGLPVLSVRPSGCCLLCVCIS